MDGVAANVTVLNDAINAKKIGEKIRLHLSRAGAELDVAIAVAQNVKKTYRLSVANGATPAQTGILDAWLRKVL